MDGMCCVPPFNWLPTPAISVTHTAYTNTVYRPIHTSLWALGCCRYHSKDRICMNMFTQKSVLLLCWWGIIWLFLLFSQSYKLLYCTGFRVFILYWYCTISKVHILNSLSPTERFYKLVSLTKNNMMLRNSWSVFRMLLIEEEWYLKMLWKL